MARLRNKDIKKGDTFKALCTGYTWHVSKCKRKAKKIIMWAMPGDIGCVEMEFSMHQINTEFQKC